jgi:tetratricopeptide (TPR) repeat protein
MQFIPLSQQIGGSTMRRVLFAVFLLASYPANLRTAWAEEAVEVFENVGPTVVLLQNPEGNGTGVLIDRGGLILTNAHVVASPLRFECKIDVTQGGELKTVAFKSVKIVGVHPTKDLALVRINPKEHAGTLHAAKLAKRKASTGQRVYAIGNPAGGGMVLSKTITTGIVSGVGRVIDGVAYYQVSAAINPGNSGGPLCDKSGEVIGLVTLKFTDVDNVGFAIPLHDLKLNEFVPFSKRKADPEKSRELVARANEFYERSRDVFRQTRDTQDPEYRFYSAMAARCYHIAITHDPANSALFYNVGMLLRGLDEDELAAAYLLHSIQLAPWGDSEANHFRELGFALVKQGEKDNARAAWLEGITKHPVKGAKIWEDLAIFYDNDQPDAYQAAKHAAVVLHLKDPHTRMHVAETILNKNRDKLSDADRAKFDRERTTIPNELMKLDLASQQQRRARVAYVTPEFKKLVATLGVLDDANPEDEIVTIDIHSGDRGDGPTDPKPPDETSEEKPDLTIPRGSTNLFSELDVRADAVSGTWKFDQHALVTPITRNARLQLPSKIPAEYDLTLIVERKANLKELVIGFLHNGTQSAFLVDAQDASASGVLGMRSGVYRGQVLEPRKPVTIVMKIRKEGLLVMAGDESVFFQKTASFPAVSETWDVPLDDRLFLGSNLTRFHIHKMMLTPYHRP